MLIYGYTYRLQVHWAIFVNNWRIFIIDSIYIFNIYSQCNSYKYKLQVRFSFKGT